jgi:N-acetyl-alpha-D-muramate 1-phosphate uridylyltransferase
MKLPVAILAGGLATRLHPITETIPKALVEVAGKPFILRQLDYLRRQGVGRVVLCTGFLGEQIEAVVGDGAASGLSLSYSQDWPNLKGTGGALRQALPLLDSQFLVLNGDSYLPIDFASVERVFLASGKPALMTVQRNADRWDKSNVLFRDNVIVEYNKSAPSSDMRHIDYGLGAISAQVLVDENTTGPFDLADVYHRLSLSGQLAGYEVHERFYEIGSHEGLAEAADYFKGGGK